MRTVSFQNQFIGMSMHQTFNLEGTDFRSDEKESALTKWLKARDQAEHPAPKFVFKIPTTATQH